MSRSTVAPLLDKDPSGTDLSGVLSALCDVIFKTPMIPVQSLVLSIKALETQRSYFLEKLEGSCVVQFTTKELQIFKAARQRLYTENDIEGSFYEHGGDEGIVALILFFKKSNNFGRQWSNIYKDFQPWLVRDVVKMIHTEVIESILKGIFEQYDFIQTTTKRQYVGNNAGRREPDKSSVLKQDIFRSTGIFIPVQFSPGRKRQGGSLLSSQEKRQRITIEKSPVPKQDDFSSTGIIASSQNVLPHAGGLPELPPISDILNYDKAIHILNPSTIRLPPMVPKDEITIDGRHFREGTTATSPTTTQYPIQSFRDQQSNTAVSGSWQNLTSVDSFRKKVLVQMVEEQPMEIPG